MAELPIGTVIHGDCREVVRAWPAASVDCIITDPPYGLEFMGQEWDKLARPKAGNLGGFSDGNKPSFARVRSHLAAMQEWHERWAREALRVAKPGAFLLAFGGTRTYHRLACGIEDAGWELRDTIGWIYGSGFPKSLDIGKAIDKAKGAKREVVGRVSSVPTRWMTDQWDRSLRGDGMPLPLTEESHTKVRTLTAPTTPLAKLWHGWGTALKPAWEPITVAQKPLDGTYANNAEKWGVAGLHVDGGRVATCRPAKKRSGRRDRRIGFHMTDGGNVENEGRWPANVIHDGSEEVLACFDQAGERAAGGQPQTRGPDGERAAFGDFAGGPAIPGIGSSSGSAARFFKCCAWAEEDLAAWAWRFEYCAKASRSERTANGAVENRHPTVKPLSLMRYLVGLTATPTGGIVLDPFAGSGSTLIAAAQCGRPWVGIEKDPESAKTARERIKGTVPLFS